ncbi:MAG TPA: hypothetical protein VFX60_14730 [Micromonospora sp.]|nr:hypothetical protein [Micromonospora sp.]
MSPAPVRPGLRRPHRTAGETAAPRHAARAARRRTAAVKPAGVPEEYGPGPLAPIRRRRGLTDNFRLIGSHRPAPPDDRVLGIYAVATGLGLAGLAVALRGLAAISAEADPSWYEPALAAIGLGGVGLTVAALVTAQRDRLPWLLLGLAIAPFGVNLALTLVVL